MEKFVYSLLFMNENVKVILKCLFEPAGTQRNGESAKHPGRNAAQWLWGN